jgi:hypothetical protein
VSSTPEPQPEDTTGKRGPYRPRLKPRTASAELVPLEGGGFEVVKLPKQRPTRGLRRAAGTYSAPDPTEGGELEYPGMKQQYDWEAAKEWYLNHVEEVPFKKVAEMFNIPVQQLYNRSGRERWQHQRLQAQTALLRDRRHKRQFKTIKEAEAFDDGALNTAKLGASLITGRLAQIAELFNAKRDQYDDAIARIQAGQVVKREDLYSAVNYREMVELAKAMEVFQNIGRRALGTDVQTISMIMDGTDGAIAEAAATVGDELGKVDPDRIAAMFDALLDAGIATPTLDANGEIIGFDLEGEVVDPESQRALEAARYTSTETTDIPATTPEESP